MSEEEKESSSSYESGSSSDESSSEEETVIKPVFVSKAQRNTQQTPPATKETTKDEDQRRKEIIYSKLDTKETETTTLSKKDEFDGADDTDDIEPEVEFENWKSRELARFQRDFEIIKQVELEKEDQLKRQLQDQAK
ncbi:hypothetical protein Cantr_10684 [Candida viswanathii]|uniref:Micro-fibrillar-associated protein 1 C-terminal domain-containing protein n=1 Tax=Candida viswanathii TaxID=5486 RepID=A0A367YDX9_9ASCO|nr:hypothetical protein Cantr_10684 [Candida viswanathii]